MLFSHLLDTQHRIPRIVRFLGWRRGLHALRVLDQVPGDLELLLRRLALE